LTDRWGPPFGGRERYLFDLVGSARQAGFRVRVFCDAGADGREGIDVETRRPFEKAEGPVLAAKVVPRGVATHVQLHGGLLRDAFEAERESMSGLRRALYRPALRLNA